MTAAKVSESHGAQRSSFLRKWRVLIMGLPLLLLGFAANHLEYHYRHKRILAAATLGSLVVRAETNLSGHNQIGIDESSLAASKERQLLTFSTLEEWAFDPQKPSDCPADIRALNGRESSCVGFMYPLEAGTRLRLFCLLRTTQTCCYGPRPQYSQYLFVEMKEPVKFERFAPVTVNGRFFVDPQPGQGYIYRIEGESLASASEDQPEPEASQVAKKVEAPLFDFAVLDVMERQKPLTVIPATLLNLDGKKVVMEGFVLDRRESPVPRFVLSRDWWDGKAQGKPPTIYNAAAVFLRDPRNIPSAWKQRGVFIGTLRVTRDPAAWRNEGIASLRDAVAAGIGQRRSGLRVDSGLFLPVREEVIVLAVFVFMAARAARVRNEIVPIEGTTHREKQR